MKPGRVLSRRRKLALIGAVVLVTVTGCANVPLETKPQAIREDGASDNETEDARPPAEDLTAADVVRAFVETNAQEADLYAASRQYLDPGAAKSWRPDKTVTILDEDFNTIPAPRAEQPSDPNETIIKLIGESVGKLLPDDSFTPSDEVIERRILLRKQPGSDEWRIVDPPDEAITSEPEFSSYYLVTRLYYYAPNSDVLVPDLRYIAAKPTDGLASRITQALLDGPSLALGTAVDNPLGAATLETNVREVGSALEIPLTGLLGASTEVRRRIVAQVVMSLENVDLVRLLAEGKPLLPNRTEWRRSDLQDAAPQIADSDGYAVLNGELISLANGKPPVGPAGNGAYNIVSAAQSLKGEQVAVVEDLGRKQRLRVGQIDKDLARVSISGSELTRPTWQPAYPGNDVSSEVWTVADGERVVRAQLTQDGTWEARPVDAKDVQRFGDITSFRLSRDGTRAAIVADGRLLVAAVVRTPNAVKLRAPRQLQPAMLADVLDVDWTNQRELVVATSSTSQPVFQVSVDGFSATAYNGSNLLPPVTGITALPGGRVLATDDTGLSTVTSTGEPWDAHRFSRQGMTSPLYPG